MKLAALKFRRSLFPERTEGFLVVFGAEAGVKGSTFHFYLLLEAVMDTLTYRLFGQLNSY